MGATANADQEELGLLVIEDDATFARIVGELAARERFRPLYAGRGDVGLAMAQQLRPGAIILDLNLPGVDGWSLLDRLKNDAVTAHIPVLVMSGDSRSALAEKFGAYRFIEKPVEGDLLLQILCSLHEFATARARSLLIVEPEPQRLQELLDLLQGDDIAITTAVSSAEAASAISDRTFDCALIASRLPDGAATDVARALQEKKRDVSLVLFLRSEEETLPRGGLARGSRVHIVSSVDQALERTARLLHRREARLPERSRLALRKALRAESLLKGRKVMVVDDDQPSTFALRYLLESHGMIVSVAPDGPQCLEILSRGPTRDIILMDIMLPDMDGYEVIRRIRKMAGYEKSPIIALTALAMKGDREKCLGAGASNYLPKPIDTDQLLALLRVSLMKASLAAQ